MSILAVDEVMLREPRLLVPNLQPVGLTKVDWSNPLARGLAYYDLLVPADPRDIIVGTKIVSTPKGRLRGFGSTYGVATTDSVKTPITRLGNSRTFAITACRMGGGGGTYGRLFEKRVSSAQTEVFLYDPANAEFNYSWVEVSKNGNRLFPHPFTIGTEFDILLTGEGISGSVAKLYVNGVEVNSITDGVPPFSGAYIDNTDQYVIGNRLNDNARNFDGYLANCFMWNRVLSPTEVAAFTANKFQFLIPA